VSVDRNSVDRNSVDRNSVDGNSVNQDSVDQNSVNGHVSGAGPNSPAKPRPRPARVPAAKGQGGSGRKSERKGERKKDRKPERKLDRKSDWKPDWKNESRSDRAENKPRGSRATGTRRTSLDTPLESRRALRGPTVDTETFGRWSERFARFMGTASFLVGMTIFVGGWLAWNWVAPADLQFDPRRLNFTLMTLILSLQASYAAPLILLAQNRQADRDRVTAEQDRDRAERALADTEYLAREVAALRIALGEVATRDFVRSELRDLLGELEEMDRQRGKTHDTFGSTQEVDLPTDSG
jgi:uncharacterized membrane protein